MGQGRRRSTSGGDLIRRATGILAPAALLAAAISLIIMPGEARAAASDGIQMCITVIIPSLFPFMVLASMAVSMDYASKLGKLLQRPVNRLLHLPGVCAAALAAGLISGFPVGARVAAGLYENRECTKEEAERMLAFCSNCGPAFIFGFAGAAILGSAGAGLLLFVSQTAAALIVGILMRPETVCLRNAASGADGREKSSGFGSVFSAAVRGSFSSVMDVCAFVIMFSVLGGLMDSSGLTQAVCGFLSRLGVMPEISSAILHGFVEMTSGIRLLGGEAIPLAVRVSLCAAIIGWSGISVHFQVLSVTEASGLKLRFYLRGKLLTSLLSALFAAAPFCLSSFGAKIPNVGIRAVANVCLLLLLPVIWVIIRIKGENRYGKKDKEEV